MSWTVEHTVDAEQYPRKDDGSYTEICVMSNDGGWIRLAVDGHGLVYDPSHARAQVVLSPSAARRLAGFLIAESAPAEVVPQGRVAEAVAIIEGPLRSALIKYGAHTERCDDLTRSAQAPCTCGWDKMKKELGIVNVAAVPGTATLSIHTSSCRTHWIASASSRVQGVKRLAHTLLECELFAGHPLPHRCTHKYGDRTDVYEFDGCDHGLTFDAEAANAIPPSELRMREIRLRWPRLDGPCPKGCGYEGIAYVSFEHYTAGDW